MKALLRLISVLSFVILAAAVGTQDDMVNGVVTRLQGNVVAMQDAIPRPLRVGGNILGGEAPNAAVRVLQGAFKSVSGELVKVANASFVVETELATIGIRGTTIWGGILDDTFDVALLEGKSIYVETKAGRVEITTPGEGTSVRTAHDAPSPPKAWTKAKVDRAMATVTFR